MGGNYLKTVACESKRRPGVFPVYHLLWRLVPRKHDRGCVWIPGRGIRRNPSLFSFKIPSSDLSVYCASRYAYCYAVFLKIFQQINWETAESDLYHPIAQATAGTGRQNLLMWAAERRTIRLWKNSWGWPKNFIDEMIGKWFVYLSSKIPRPATGWCSCRFTITY